MRIHLGILGRVGLPQEDYCCLLPPHSPDAQQRQLSPSVWEEHFGMSSFHYRSVRSGVALR